VTAQPLAPVIPSSAVLAARRRARSAAGRPLPLARGAVSPAGRGVRDRRIDLAYGSYWNRVVEQWGTRRLDEPTPSEIKQVVISACAAVSLLSGSARDYCHQQAGRDSAAPEHSHARPPDRAYLDGNDM
jgi:hypothetical protein